MHSINILEVNVYEGLADIVIPDQYTSITDTLKFWLLNISGQEILIISYKYIFLEFNFYKQLAHFLHLFLYFVL